MKEVSDIKKGFSRVLKQIIITQLLSIIFSILGEIYLRLLITYDWLFTDFRLLILGISLLTLFYIIMVMFFVKGNWLNVLLISVPYVVYWSLILYKGSKLFPTHTDPNDFGVGIMGIVIGICVWISIIIGCVIGTYLNKRRYRIKNIS